jgi:hypothetical protein
LLYLVDVTHQPILELVLDAVDEELDEPRWLIKAEVPFTSIILQAFELH